MAMVVLFFFVSIIHSIVTLLIIILCVFHTEKKILYPTTNNEPDFLDPERNDEFVGFTLFFYFCVYVHIL